MDGSALERPIQGFTCYRCGTLHPHLEALIRCVEAKKLKTEENTVRRTTRTPLDIALNADHRYRAAQKNLDTAQRLANASVGRLTPDEFNEFANITLERDRIEGERELAQMEREEAREGTTAV